MFSLLSPGKNRALALTGLIISSALINSGCASNEKRLDEAAPTLAQKNDPYEGFNRPMYNFNMGLDRHLLKPVATGYKFIMPDFMETGVSNFFTNLKGINVVLNDTLQGKFGQSAEDTGRFLTNTTLGVGGLFDVASEFGMKSNVEDFGQTLAVWGVDQGAYLVLPILGPTTFRDGGGLILDKAANPGTYAPGVGLLEGINDRANADGALNFIDEAALDPYVFTRESFLQYRNNLINDGKTDKAAMDELDIDAALEDEIGSKPKSDAKSGNSAKSKTTAPTSVSANTANTSNSSLSNVEEEFASADEKMDQLLAKKHRKRRR